MSKPIKYVYSVQETGAKPFWFRVGAIFLNKDGSETMALNCYPLPDEKGKLRLQIRSADEKEEAPHPQQNHRNTASKPSYRDDQDVGY